MNKYPEKIKNILKGKYERLDYHEKKIKNVKKYRKTRKKYTLFPSISIYVDSYCILSTKAWTISIPGKLTKAEQKLVHRHQYNINKIKKDIEGIKKKFG